MDGWMGCMGFWVWCLWDGEGREGGLASFQLTANQRPLSRPIVLGRLGGG